MIIAYDTCTDRVTTASLQHSWRADEEKGGNRQLLAGIQFLLDKENLEFQDITDLYFTSGPGSFTGVRVGIAAALGFFYGKGIRLHPVSTLLALAWSHDRKGEFEVQLPAYRGHRYRASYRVGESSTIQVIPPTLVKVSSGFTPPEVPVSIAEAIMRHRDEIPPCEPPIQPDYIGVSDAER